MIQNIAAKCVATLSVIFAVAGSPALGADDATFGQAPSFNSDVGFTLGVSTDKKAFTIIFGNLTASIDGKSSAPVVTRMFSFVLPLAGADPSLEIPFFVSGFVLTQKGANGHLVFSVNDQTTVADFAENSNTDFIQQLKYKVGSASEVRITVFLLADRARRPNGLTLSRERMAVGRAGTDVGATSTPVRLSTSTGAAADTTSTTPDVAFSSAADGLH